MADTGQYLTNIEVNKDKNPRDISTGVLYDLVMYELRTTGNVDPSLWNELMVRPDASDGMIEAAQQAQIDASRLNVSPTGQPGQEFKPEPFEYSNVPFGESGGPGGGVARPKPYSRAGDTLGSMNSTAAPWLPASGNQTLGVPSGAPVDPNAIPLVPTDQTGTGAPGGAGFGSGGTPIPYIDSMMAAGNAMMGQPNTPAGQPIYTDDTAYVHPGYGAPWMLPGNDRPPVTPGGPQSPTPSQAYASVAAVGNQMMGQPNTPPGEPIFTDDTAYVHPGYGAPWMLPGNDRPPVQMAPGATVGSEGTTAATVPNTTGGAVDTGTGGGSVSADQPWNSPGGNIPYGGGVFVGVPGAENDIANTAQFGGLDVGQQFDPVTGNPQFKDWGLTYELGPDAWLVNQGISATGVAPGGAFSPASDMGQRNLIREVTDEQGLPPWMARRDQPMMQSMQGLAMYMDPDGQTGMSQEQLANQYPEMYAAINTPGQYVDAGKAYDSVVTGTWGDTSMASLKPEEQVGYLNAGLDMLAPYYDEQSLGLLYARVDEAVSVWSRGVATDPAFAAAYPTITEYLRAQGADNWM